MNHEINSPIQEIRLAYGVPYYAQVASRELAQLIFEEGFDAAADPRWEEWGAASPAEYAYWAWRACGIACVKMCAEALGVPQRPMMDWVRRGLAMDGYLVQEQDGKVVEKGWIHRCLADLLCAEGLYADALQADLTEIVKFLEQGCLVIASASYQLGLPVEITEKGGHLVVVTGADLQDGLPVAFYLHNPSGRTQELQENACISTDRFAAAFSGRVIMVGMHR